MRRSVRRHILIYALIGLAVLLPLSIFVYQFYKGTEIYERQAATVQTTGAFSFVDDPSRGYLTLENDIIKVVWHYKVRAVEYTNRGGGNIYELYDKRTDPGATRNIVAVANLGTGGTSPPTAGIGGLGATHMWESGSLVATSDNAAFARLVSRNHYVNADGNAVFEASFIVKSNINDRPDNYRVDKTWEVHPDGQIKLTIHEEILRTHDIKEPAYDFSFSQDYGWTTASSIGHNWVRTICGGIGSNGVQNASNRETVINNIHQTPDYDNQFLHSESFNLYGAENGVSVRLKMDNGGRGFEGGGLFSLGASLWNTTANPTVEYSNYRTLAYGHTLRYFGWWGGWPDTPRYKTVTAGTNWTDTVWIEIVPSAIRAAPQMVSDIAKRETSETTAEMRWATNLASDTKVRYWRAGEDPRELADTEWRPDHVLAIPDLSWGETYQYEVSSHDGAGVATSSGSFTMGEGDMLSLSISLSDVNWQNYSDYLNRKLTATFNLANLGNATAYSTEVMEIRSSTGITAQPVTANVGDIAPNETKELEVVYEVPPGIRTFSTTVFTAAYDSREVRHFFPREPGL